MGQGKKGEGTWEIFFEGKRAPWDEAESPSVTLI